MSWVNMLGLVFVIGSIYGIRLMSSPVTAVSGNLVGSLSMAGAIILTLVAEGIVSIPVLWVAIAVGALSGYYLAVKVAMIQMPQMVALLNGFGGGSSAIVSLLALLGILGDIAATDKLTAALGLVIGSITLSGSLIAAAKLHGKMEQKPILFKGQSTWNNLALVLIGLLFVSIFPAGSEGIPIRAFGILVLSLVYGVLFTIRVGGADMPITISLLNSFSGVAASISGFAVRNPLLVAVGAVVGTSGLVLTRLMCKAMNRSLSQVLAGKTVLVSKESDTGAISVHEAEISEEKCKTDTEGQDDFLSFIRDAKSVIVIPGYGMALAQAQHEVKKLTDILEDMDKEVRFAIHPVAGRMPGHMNVLLAEADVPYDKLYEMDDINEGFRETDVVIVVGANDVINPAANTAEGTPIYGMPILRAYEAKHVIIFNLDTKPGYAGVDNPLYSMDNATLVLGDAAETLLEAIYCLQEMQNSG
ncbi:MAG: NAD(P)(+) transhydrogenase (Re/Si-specific) subunit beta [Bacillota bacterium]|nr:NAD(P)(+) transhydrogenase (Re/Si-specific) subunit beta [Bacillota bacterium]MDI9414913.1 NAD(P)(+) transhydrogenase (Re/Si-specific) subunit beta [Bacillota bacterium]NLD12145.1 NAD(P)(+) transhydrogenase (Re/Si-specific) subunit beta [Bacillota bacterium]HOB89624.1 NAD(P)(+) transhydrogenase (Re/Si-specific) subunit beta [Bacillota bacterium]HOJ57103.1 NAD(P)(+) transhydrogenase (Re/Si-specific) subunit beta [Bacillota bacterium]